MNKIIVVREPKFIKKIASTRISVDYVDLLFLYFRMAKTLVELARGIKKDGFWEKTDGNLASGTVHLSCVFV